MEVRRCGPVPARGHAGSALLRSLARAVSLAGIALVLALLPGVLPATSVSATADDHDWLDRLQAARANAGLGPVTERVDWSSAAREHARYMIDNGVMVHDQDPRFAGASNTGRWAARTGNLYAATGDGRASDAMDAWLGSPGHAAWILHPGLIHVGFGADRSRTASPFRYAAVLPVVAGVDRAVPRPGRVTYPGDGSVLRSDRGSSAPLSVRMLHLFRGDLVTELQGRVEVRVTVDDREVEVSSLELREGHLAIGLARPLPAEATMSALVLVDGRYDDRWTFATSRTMSAPPMARQRPAPAPWDIDGDVHETAIRTLLDTGVVTGHLDGSFRPSADVSRGQFATMLDGVLAPGSGDGRGAVPPDSDGSVHAAAISAVVAQGWMVGGADARFRPSDPVTRGQLASTLASALALRLETDSASDTHAVPPDVVGTTHQTGIAALLSAGLAEGYDDGTFRPDEPVSRGQLASVLMAGTAP